MELGYVGIFFGYFLKHLSKATHALSYKLVIRCMFKQLLQGFRNFVRSLQPASLSFPKERNALLVNVRPPDPHYPIMTLNISFLVYNAAPTGVERWP